MNFEWKITELHAAGDKITSAKYFIEATDSGNKVETEGYCYFNESGDVPLVNVTEAQVIQWIKESTTVDGVCHITKRLEEQLNYLDAQKKINLPWRPKTFKLPI
jgi:hypothetical protein